MRTIRILLFVTIAFTSTALLAQPGKFGLGARIGEPTGISTKFWSNPNRSLNLSAAWTASRANNTNRLVLQGDYVFYSYNALQLDLENMSVPLYYGLGAQLRTGQESEAGVRIPLGIDFVFQNAPLDLFVEIAPTVNLFPSTWFEVNGGVGIHYFF